MATVQEILDSIKSSTSSNVNNNSFIELMQQISGNPEDAVSPANDTNSIYGHIVQIYTELFDGSTDYAEISANLGTITEVFNNLDTINSVNDSKVILESILFTTSFSSKGGSSNSKVVSKKSSQEIRKKLNRMIIIYFIIELLIF